MSNGSDAHQNVQGKLVWPEKHAQSALCQS